MRRIFEWLCSKMGYMAIPMRKKMTDAEFIATTMSNVLLNNSIYCVDHLTGRGVRLISVVFSSRKESDQRKQKLYLCMDEEDVISVVPRGSWGGGNQIEDLW